MKRRSRFCRIFRLVIGAAALISLSLPAPAVVVGWYPGNLMQPGSGMRLNQSQPVSQTPLVEMSSTGTNLNDGWQSESVIFAQHTEDTVKSLNLNFSASVETLFGGGSIDLGIWQQQNFDENHLNFVFTKIRNFGTTLYTPFGFNSDFTNDAANYQSAGYQGEALYAALTSKYGTHYVRGKQTEHYVSVLYSFEYTSASVKNKLTLTASGSAWDSASFSAFVSSFFGSTNTTVKMNYQLIYTGGSVPPFPASAIIANYQAFTNFVSELEAFINSKTPGDALTTGWIVDPIQSVPGYFSLVGGYVSPPENLADYGDFLQANSALQVWNQRLTNLTVNAAAGSMSWFNTNADGGQELIKSKTVDIGKYLSAMALIASNHYYYNAPLYVPGDVVTYLANLSDIALPGIYVLDNFSDSFFDACVGVNAFYQCIIGRIDCGDRNLVKTLPEIPFANVIQFTNGANNATTIAIDYDPYHFQTNTLDFYKSSCAYGHLIGHLENVFTNSQWACLTNPAINSDYNGFFVAVQKAANSGPGQSANWSLALQDGRGTNLDVMSFLDTRSGGCGNPSLVSNAVSVAIAGTPPTNTCVVGLAQPVTLQVNNQAPVQAYGTTVSFVLSDAFDFGGASGSQGYASFTNGVVTYALGPLLPGATANITFNLIPLRSGLVVPGTPALLSLGVGLTNSNPAATNSFSAIQSVPAVLHMARTAGGHLLFDWWSDTDRLLMQSSPALGSGGWLPVINNGVVHGNHWFSPQQMPGMQGYFRLQSQ